MLQKIMLNSKLRLAMCALAVASMAGCASTMHEEQKASASTQQTSSKEPAKEASANRSGVRKVKGRGGWEGYISGQSWKGAKFNRLEVGMSYKQVQDLVGPPTDQYSHVTGKAWIPFYFGSGRYEHKLLYKGQGRLVFAGDAGFSSNSHLIGIEFNAGESGYQ